jgi:hypothetical protein
MDISTPSGCHVARADERVRAFLAAEWPYYDGLADTDPDRITVVDVLAPVMLNAYSFGMGADKLQRIHRQFAAACEPLLADIPADADLRSFDPELSRVRAVLAAAVHVPNVLVPVATKILHRKRRRLIPVLDNVLLEFYLGVAGVKPYRTQDKLQAADLAVVALRLLRTDLIGCEEPLASLASSAARAGHPVGPLRLLEVLIWSELEPRGYYRG